MKKLPDVKCPHCGRPISFREAEWTMIHFFRMLKAYIIRTGNLSKNLWKPVASNFERDKCLDAFRKLYFDKYVERATKNRGDVNIIHYRTIGEILDHDFSNNIKARKKEILEALGTTWISKIAKWWDKLSTE